MGGGGGSGEEGGHKGETWGREEGEYMSIFLKN